MFGMCEKTRAHEGSMPCHRGNMQAPEVSTLRRQSTKVKSTFGLNWTVRWLFSSCIRACTPTLPIRWKEVAQMIVMHQTHKKLNAFYTRFEKENIDVPSQAPKAVDDTVNLVIEAGVRRSFRRWTLRKHTALIHPVLGHILKTCMDHLTGTFADIFYLLLPQSVVFHLLQKNILNIGAHSNMPHWLPTSVTNVCGEEMLWKVSHDAHQHLS